MDRSFVVISDTLRQRVKEHKLSQVEVIPYVQMSSLEKKTSEG